MSAQRKIARGLVMMNYCFGFPIGIFTLILGLLFVLRKGDVSSTDQMFYDPGPTRGEVTFYLAGIVLFALGCLVDHGYHRIAYAENAWHPSHNIWWWCSILYNLGLGILVGRAFWPASTYWVVIMLFSIYGLVDWNIHRHRNAGKELPEE